MHKNIKPYHLALFGILLFAFIIRIFPRLFLPYFYMDDETINMVIPILKMIHAHSLDPHFYKYGTLIHYLTIPLYEIYIHIKHVSPLPPPSLDFLNPSFYYIGRYESALFDMLTIFITYKAGERIFNKKVALVAAIFMIFNPDELFMSHLFKPDTFMTFFSMCVFYFSIRIKEENKFKWYVLAGIFSGFAMSTRLDIFVLVMPMAGWFLYYGKKPSLDMLQKQKAMNLIILLLSACLSFCLTSPYLVLHIPAFLHATAHEFSREQHIGLVQDIFHKKIIAQVFIVFPIVLSLSIYVLSLYGVYLYVKKRGFYEALFYVIYPLLYFIIVTFVSDRPSYAGGGYFYLAILPFFILLGSYGFMHLWDKIDRKSLRILFALIVSIDVLSASGSFVNSIYTHNTLGNWIYKNIPQHSSLLIMNSFRPVLQWRYYVSPIYTETIKWSPPLENNLKMFYPDYVIATGFDIYLEGGYRKFNQLMRDNNYHLVKTIVPRCTPYLYLYSSFVPDVNRGTIYIYKVH